MKKSERENDAAFPKANNDTSTNAKTLRKADKVKLTMDSFIKENSSSLRTNYRVCDSL